MLTKQCTSCGKVLEATEANFHIKKGGKYGLHSECRECRLKRRRNNYRRDKEIHENYSIIGDCFYKKEDNNILICQKGSRIILSTEQLKTILKNVCTEPQIQ